MSVSYLGPLRAPFLLYSQVYRIVERKCRIVKGIFPFIALVFTLENAIFPIGVYRTVPVSGWGVGTLAGDDERKRLLKS